jgi:hypothetical protein
MDPAAVVTLIAVVLVILALVFYLVSVILELRKITAGLDAVIGSVGEILQKTEPVNGVVDSIYPGAGAAVLARQGRSGEVKNIDVVYTRGAVQLARLGRESPLGVGAMSGVALRDARYSSTAARSIYSNPSGPIVDEPGGEPHRPTSPTIGTEAAGD